jgi:hypothetical protein
MWKRKMRWGNWEGTRMPKLLRNFLCRIFKVLFNAKVKKVLLALSVCSREPIILQGLNGNFISLQDVLQAQNYISINTGS